MHWRQFVMDLETLNPDSVETILARHGALAISLTDAGDKPVLEPAPGETPLWHDTRITALFAPDADLGGLQEDLLQSLELDALPAHAVSDLETRAWEREWLRDFGPMRFGERLWICPGDNEVDDQHAVVVRLDPGLAFGTGTHATTALCLEWLDHLSLDNSSLCGKTVLDYGCGSGVLAIAAVLLGCKSATAMDIDPQAVTATRSNAANNNVAERITVVGSDDAVAGQFDVVVANILAGPIIELAELISARARPGCLLALSGILSEQVDDVITAYNPGFEFDVPALREQGGQTWARLTGRRIEG